MDKSKSAIVRATITYFFKETFRAHSKAEYREIFSRGLNEDNSGMTGAFPWLYVRAFFALFILFTVNVLVLRLTDNALFVPSVTFLGGITFTIPFTMFLYELYPKRDLSLFMLLALLVCGGTVASVLTQIGYTLLPVKNEWISAIVSGVLEEACKAIPVIIIILFFKHKNPYTGFLIGAAVGAGFSIIEDMGYIFYYSDKYTSLYSNDVQATIVLFLDRGLSSFCTHVLWTGAIGWAYIISKRPFRSVWLLFMAGSMAVHISWNLPIEGWLQALVISICVIIAVAVNIAIVHKSRMNILSSETDLTQINLTIINEAKQMGELMRFRNAANLTFSLTCTLLSVIILILCALPIGIDYKKIEFDSPEAFIEYVHGDYKLKADRGRKMRDPYNPDNNVEELILENEDGEHVLSYVVQRDTLEGYDGEYYYEYYVSDGNIFSISVMLEDINSRIKCTEFKFGSEEIWAFEVDPEKLIDYTYNKDGTVTAITNAEEFGGYNLLIGLCAAACAISLGCTVILVAFTIKLRRVKNEEKQ